MEHTFTSLSNLTGLDVHVFSSVVTVDGIAERSALEGSEQSDEKEDPDFFDKSISIIKDYLSWSYMSEVSVLLLLLIVCKQFCLVYNIMTSLC